MNFPLVIRLGSFELPAHLLFESLGYLVAYLLYRRQRQLTGDVVDAAVRRWLTAAALAGGLIGARLLHLLEDPSLALRSWVDPMFLASGKTIVGGLIGGLIAVELTKKRFGVAVATGDLLAVPLCAGIAIGRVGCFLSGLSDGTHGVETSMPWGVNFGDGLSRHPTQLYEVAFVLVLAGVLVARRRRLAAVTGDAFKLFMVGYLGFRFAVDFLKPGADVGWLGALQWACLATLAYYVPHVRRLASEVSGG
jgi:prolipoprotein diacylglyceryltransferase